MGTRQGRAPDPRGHPVRRLLLFFGRKKANFWKKSGRRFQSNRSYGSPYIYETVKGQNTRTQKQRDRSNLGGALAPPMPWRPRTRGETLLPSREEVKEEEEQDGPPSPLLFRWHRSATGGHHHHHDLHQHLRHLHQHLHHLPPSIYSGPLSRNPLYPLLEHGALCFILLSNDVLPSYDV